MTAKKKEEKNAILALVAVATIKNAQIIAIANTANIAKNAPLVITAKLAKTKPDTIKSLNIVSMFHILIALSITKNLSPLAAALAILNPSIKRRICLLIAHVKNRKNRKERVAMVAVMPIYATIN